VVLARETPIGEIRRISKIIETEVFVQGALCTCFSGQCYFSSFVGNNSGNRGRCKQPCRKRYSIDRKGYEEYAYALSPSDLCVGEKIFALLGAGVSSLKIEGRLRREEYVRAAVLYYRKLLRGDATEKDFSRLRRAYNRGDYTRGLAFGQQKDFLSREVQGHIGEKMGNLVLRGGAYFCGGTAQAGDAFKILRGGKEIGGAVFRSAEKDGFYLSSMQRLRAGDEVRMTTDAAEYPRERRVRRISLAIRAVAGEKTRVEGGGITLEGDIPARARSAPLSREEIAACFLKTSLPLEVTFSDIETKDAFLPKSALNALRRAFYEKLANAAEGTRTVGRTIPALPAPKLCEEEKIALITSDFRGKSASVLILKPRDYSAVTRADVGAGSGEKFLYLPPFLTSDELEAVAPIAAYFDGIYSDGYYAVLAAKRWGKAFFAGSGFHVTNRFTLRGVKEAGARYVALSDEISGAQQRALAEENVFALTLGGIKLMNLCYCPFERTCADCDRRSAYTLSDEEGRRFPLYRYRIGGACRFEVYNCASLAAYNGRSGAIVDLTGDERQLLAAYAKSPSAAPLTRTTKGHSERSML